MRPAFSVIFFTVLSGAGLGLVALALLGQMAGPGFVMTPRTHMAAVITGLALVGVGFLSSSLHLANPRNGWRAVTQFRHSWLSREAVLGIVLFPLAGLYLVGVDAGNPGGVARWFGLSVVSLAVAILYCTGMIYACLRTIPRWHTGLVPASYLALGGYSGCLLALAFAAADGARVDGWVTLALILLMVAAGIKGVYFRRFAAPGAEHTLSRALGVTTQAARILDPGHTGGTFLTREFVFQVARERAVLLRYLFLVLSFALPLALVGWFSGSAIALGIAAIACLAGLVVERWLFFAEAQHVVRLFHGQQAV